MLWQQRLGQLSPAIKKFANQWSYLSWVNFILIIVINLMFVQYFVQKDGQLTFEPPDRRSLVEGVGLIQTTIAFIVLFSYYLENWAKFKYIIAEAAQNNKEELQNFGLQKGSNAFGMRRSFKVSIKVTEPGILKFVRKYSQKNIITKILVYIL